MKNKNVSPKSEGFIHISDCMIIHKLNNLLFGDLPDESLDGRQSYRERIFSLMMGPFTQFDDGDIRPLLNEEDGCAAVAELEKLPQHGRTSIAALMIVIGVVLDHPCPFEFLVSRFRDIPRFGAGRLDLIAVRREWKDDAAYLSNEITPLLAEWLV